MMLNGLYMLAWVALIMGAVRYIPRAIAHDRRMAALENLDDEELAACIEVDPDYIAKARRW